MSTKLKSSTDQSVMSKSEAICIFTKTEEPPRGGVTRLAEALGVQQPAVWKWPEQLLIWQADQIRGAAIRLGHKIPSHLRKEP